MKSNPNFTIYCGPMFSSKTSRLLMELERFKYQHKNFVVFKPLIDSRYSDTNIVTHAGWTQPAINVKTGADILYHLSEMDSEPHLIAVDEAFMIPGVSDVLIFLFKSGFNVLVSSLDMASNGRPFAEISQMLPWATHIKKCTAICTVCGQNAHYTHKKIDGGDEHLVHVGGSELYEPRCFEHHPGIKTIKGRA